MDWIDDKIVGFMIAITNAVTWLICPEFRKPPDLSFMGPEILDSATTGTRGRVLQFPTRDRCRR
jgi:hypothetical protein